MSRIGSLRQGGNSLGGTLSASLGGPATPPQQAPPGVPLYDEDGVPTKWLNFAMNASPKKVLGKKDQDEVMGYVDKLAAKGKYQKASNLLYAIKIADPHNEVLAQRWTDLIDKVNKQNVEIHKKQAADAAARELAEDKAAKGAAANLSETKRWEQLREKKLLPENDPNWHLSKLKPWMGPEAYKLGMTYRTNAASIQDPFQKLWALEEACKMFNKVLEIKPQDEQARRMLSEVCDEMNVLYIKMKGIKKEVKRLDPDAPLTRVGDFMQSRNEWVQQARQLKVTQK